jgi:uncharacterized protein (DUF111 family)
MDKLFEAKAVDVWFTPIVMKKNRLATKISALVEKDKKDEAAAIILKETSSLGLRFSEVNRIEAERKVKTVKTSFGEIRVKFAYFEGELVNVAPEFECCKKIAEKKKIPLKKIYQEALKSVMSSER